MGLPCLVDEIGQPTAEGTNLCCCYRIEEKYIILAYEGVKIACHGWKWLDMAVNDWNGLTWLEMAGMAGYCWTWLQMAGIAGHGWKRL